MSYRAGRRILQHPPTELSHVISEVLALRMNEEVAGQLHTNTINIQDAQDARIWELEKQDILAKSLEECQHQSVMCQALLTHYVESHWVPIGLLLEQIGSRSSCGLFPPQPQYCDLHNGEVVIEGADGPPSPSSLPSLESISSSSIDSVYYTPAFLQSSQGMTSYSPSEVVPLLLQGRSSPSPMLSPSFSGDPGSLSLFDQGVVDKTDFTGFPLLGNEGWGSGGSGGDAVDSVGVGY